MYSHILAIGCTGMLFEASVVLSRGCRSLTSVARTEASLNRLDAAIAGAGCAHHALALDWSQPDAFVAAVAAGVHRFGDPDLILAWLHHDGLGPRLAQALAPSGKCCAFFHVRGSMAANTAERADAILQRGDIPSTIDYHQVILGFHAGDDGSRWLHDTEICAGVLDAIEHPRPMTLVGTTEPWDDRP